jgi:protein-S-isoprenylcysteine O-methyltransferase Ste14
MHRLELKIPPAFLLLIGVGGIWLISRTLRQLTVIPDAIGDPLATVLWISGAIIGVAGVVQFARARTTVDPHRANRASSLVTGGVYTLTRNPMYLGMLLFLVGAVLGSGNVATLIVLPAYVGYMNRFQIQPEERILTDLFGDEYLAFMSTTRRWV